MWRHAPDCQTTDVTGRAAQVAGTADLPVFVAAPSVDGTQVRARAGGGSTSISVLETGEVLVWGDNSATAARLALAWIIGGRFGAPG